MNNQLKKAIKSNNLPEAVSLISDGLEQTLDDIDAVLTMIYSNKYEDYLTGDGPGEFRVNSVWQLEDVARPLNRIEKDIKISLDDVAISLRNAKNVRQHED